MGVAEASVLEAQVETCRQLLELEPRSRGEPRPPHPRKILGVSAPPDAGTRPHPSGVSPGGAQAAC